MRKIILEKAEKKFPHLNGYWLGGRKSASREIIGLADQYKMNYLKKIMPISPADLAPGSPKRRGLGGDLTVTLKRDGMYNVLYHDSRSEPKSILCNSPNGRARYNLPLNKEFEERIDALNQGPLLWQLSNKLLSFKMDVIFARENQVHSMALAGEMFGKVRDDNDRPRIFDVMSLSRNPRTVKDLERIHFDIFDIISINEINLLNLKYSQRLTLLTILFPRTEKNARVKVIKNFKNVRVEELSLLFEKHVMRKRHEGLVIRNSYGLIFKLKNVHEIDAVIIGYTEVEVRKKIKGKDAVSSLMVALIRPDKDYQVLAKLKSGITNRQGEELHDLLSNDEMPSQYHAKSDSGKSFKFVKPNHVIQVKFLDMISSGRTGEVIQLPVLKLRADGWHVQEMVPFINLINPWFDAFRSQVDETLFRSLMPINPKEPIYTDVKLDQVHSIMDKFGIKLKNNIVKEQFLYKIAQGDKQSVYQMVQDGLLSAEYLSQDDILDMWNKIKRMKTHINHFKTRFRNT